MPDKKLYLDYAEFYITNVCNLTCDGCNRFNNVKFKGWQNWDQHKETYLKWSEQLDIGSISILGGEPLLNPTFYSWVLGLRELWPKSGLRIASNGTQLDNHQKLYDILKNDKRILFSVCVHNKMHKQDLIEKVKKFMVGPIESKFDPIPYRECLSLTDANGVTINVWHNWWFHQGAVITDPESGRFTLHQSDPIKAHEICHSKTCHHFENGKLYKCGPASLFSQFDQQFNLDISDEDRKLINSYQALTVDATINHKQQFLDNIKNPIDMCKFCPQEYHGKQIFAIDKKELKHV